MGVELIYGICSREKERKGFLEFIYLVILKNIYVNYWVESVDFIELDFFIFIFLERDCFKDFYLKVMFFFCFLSNLFWYFVGWIKY